MPSCIRCREEEAVEELGYCPGCAVHARVEFVIGFRQLTDYLGLWAALDDWYERGARPWG